MTKPAVTSSHMCFCTSLQASAGFPPPASPVAPPTSCHVLAGHARKSTRRGSLTNSPQTWLDFLLPTQNCCASVVERQVPYSPMTAGVVAPACDGWACCYIQKCAGLNVRATGPGSVSGLGTCLGDCCDWNICSFHSVPMLKSSPAV